MNPSPPPTGCFPDDNPALTPWLCEDKYWPAVHTVFPFLVYTYFHDALITAILMYAWESIEAFAVCFANSIVLDKGTENIGDSLLSDITMGLMGISIGVLAVRLGDFNYGKVPPVFDGYEAFWFKYLFQILALGLPTLFLYQYASYFANGLVSIAFLAMMVYIPLAYGLFMYWNRRDTVWYTVTQSSTTHRHGIRAKLDSYNKFHTGVGIAIFVYFGFFIYRWASVFYMAFFFNIAIIVTLGSLYMFKGVCV